MRKLRTESQEGQAVGWRPVGHQGSNRIVQRTGVILKMLPWGLFLNGPRPIKEFSCLEKWSETKI